MNPRQRRGILFLLAAAALAIAVFVAVSSYVSQVESQVGEKITVYQVTEPVQKFEPLGASNVEAIEVPRRWAAPTAVTNLREIEGRRTPFNLASGTIITSDMFVASSDLDSTEREVAINVDSVTGLAGRVEPGDLVDVYAVFADVPGLPKHVRRLVQSVRIVSIGGRQTVPDTSQEGVGGTQDVVPVTLALSPDDTLAVTYAASFAQQVRLVKLPADVGTNRKNEPDQYDAENLGGEAVPEDGE